MANQPKQIQQATSTTPPIQQHGRIAMGLKDSLEKQYLKVKEHAETYPYVWASYIVVYGGFAFWTAYRWRKLRKTKDRVRTLQERSRKKLKNLLVLPKVVEKGSTSSYTKVMEKGCTSFDTKLVE